MYNVQQLNVTSLHCNDPSLIISKMVRMPDLLTY